MLKRANEGLHAKAGAEFGRGRIAQRLEQSSYKRQVDGSNPSVPTEFLIGAYSIVVVRRIRIAETRVRLSLGPL